MIAVGALAFFPLAFVTPVSKAIKVEQSAQNWAIYLRNVDRLNYMAGRVVPSDILQATRDTIQMFHGDFYKQLNSQLPDSTAKK